MPFRVETVCRAFPGRRIVHFERVGSTMIEAARLAEEGFPPGTVVVADEQTSGQGRHGHFWHSELDSGLYVSVLLQVPVGAVLTLALGLATAEAITRETDLRCDLRWPNDILIGEKKVAGILVQLLGSAAIAGIGINVNHPSFPIPLAAEATSLRMETGLRHERENLLIALLRSIDSFCSMLVQGGAPPILRMFSHASSYAKSKRVSVRMGDRLITGITDGLDDAGFLRLRKDDGLIELILAGGVRPL
ncbi:MAG: biotin--[acetyl-CoA-carboxylase] ligase [Acidobacteriota bacterium]|nr:biotin--[acetyl-CoA-carboxylase] ligase [Acidobacteriota bacterium]